MAGSQFLIPSKYLAKHSQRVYAYVQRRRWKENESEHLVHLHLIQKSTIAYKRHITRFDVAMIPERPREEKAAQRA
jgi:hypothetical protein